MSELNKNSESLKEGSVINNLLLIQKYCPGAPSNGPYTIHKDDYLKLAKDIQANGGSPEVDNPVGQVNIEIVDDFLDQFEGNWIKEDYLILQEFVKYINKPLETTKEQSNLCECCKRNPIEAAKGMCRQCSQYW